MLHEKYLSREEAMYRQFTECVASLNRAWSILAELEDHQCPPGLARAAMHMALIEYSKPFRESGSGGEKRHSLGLPLTAEDDHLLHAYLLQQRDQVLAPSNRVVAGAVSYAGKEGSFSGEQAALTLSAALPAELPPAADIKALIERLLDVLYAQLPRLRQSSVSSSDWLRR